MSFIINPHMFAAAGPAASYFAGQITNPAGTGSQSYTGLGFRPKLVLFFSNTLATGAATQDFTYMFGAAISSSKRFVGTYRVEDDVATSQCAVGTFQNRCIAVSAGGNSTLLAFEADFVSLDSDGFTLNWLVAGGAGQKISYIAIGGTDIRSADIGTITSGTSTGNISKTGVGFLPTFALFSLAHPVASGTNAISIASTSPTLAIGATDGTNQACVVTSSGDAENPSDTYQAAFTNRCFAHISASANAINGQFSYVSFDSDGFTLNVDSAPSTSYDINYVAIKSSHAIKAGIETQKTSTGTKATTGIGRQPGALLLVGCGATAANTLTANMQISCGGATALAQSVISGAELDAQSPSEVVQTALTTKCIKYTSTSGATGIATNAEAGLSSLDSDGFTLNWTTADATARQFMYVAF